jgi:hypothetical protein
MAELQRPWPAGLRSIDGARLIGMGLGWFVHEWAGAQGLGHDGAGLGCAATLRVLPGYDAAVVCLSNAWYEGYALNGEMVRGVLEDELNVRAAEPDSAPNPHGSGRYVGTYGRLGSHIEVTAPSSDKLKAHLRQDLLYISGQTAAVVELEPVGPDLFRARGPMWPRNRVYSFIDTTGSGKCDYLYEGFRGHRRDG